MANHATTSAVDPVERNLQHAADLEGMPHEGTQAAAEHHGPEPSVLGMDATMWVSLAMLILILAVGRTVWKMLTGGLDNQIAAIRARLDEAKELRAEAEALRDEYARKMASVETEVAGMMNQAEHEAQAILAKAESDAETLVARRTRMAEDKIAAAERAAADEVRARAASAATAAAEALLREKLDANADKALVDQAITGLGRAA